MTTRYMQPMYNQLSDYGNQPYVINIEEATLYNQSYRTALWTGEHLQVTLMSIPPGDDIGLEIHPNTDQFLRIEQGMGMAYMGDTQNHLPFQQPVYANSAIMVPAGKWHNVVNTGQMPLKLYSIYAPPHHPHGTVQQTKEVAMQEET
ncbi:cupin domain-containing protein [Bacillus sp. JCM 19041]|uniref:cupin domain-containing protein n=1 Tax=Bacillus sp. JCM 19041 TaxID=1460637 RepID=UPI00336A6FBA